MCDIFALRAGRLLRSYQQEGLNWLAFNWHNGLPPQFNMVCSPPTTHDMFAFNHTGRNCLLADEMGLGKTVQSVSVLR